MVLFYHENVCCVNSLHQGDCNEYTQHTIICRKSKDTPDLSPFVSWPGAVIYLSGSNYLCLEPISMVSKMFEPLTFNSTLL